ncbi:MAG: divalent-cation tolerance protein CutA [Acidobacteria bacterium]|nr:divalent-cation tolerance protein CutA [Acidobacteriota bacterium]
MTHEPSTVVIALTTMPAEESQAVQVARALVDRQVAACVNVLAPMISTYRWQGVVEQATERQIVIKTTRARVADLKNVLAELHPYDVPELLILDVADGGKTYLEWVGENVGHL